MSNTRIPLLWGYIEYGPNEVSIVSTVGDPPGLRLASPDGGLGKISFNRLRSDGVQEEIGILQGKMDERYRGDTASRAGELTLHLHDRYGLDDEAQRHVFTMRHDSVEFHVPANCSGGSSAPSTPSAIESPNGAFRVQLQDDGNLVLYDMRGAPRAIWASNTVGL